MTLNQFKYILQPGGVLDSVDRDVNICYTGSKIQAIAVRVVGENLTQLQQATTIVLKAPQAGSTLNISLENSQVPLRTVNREQVGNYYMYSIVEQDQQPVMTAVPSPTGILPSEEYFTQVIVLPSSQGGVFEGSDYDVLLNNSLNSRLSTYIQVSDRAESSINPVNLPSILVDNAIPASIQDSNYSNTGWINGRYNGTPTDGNTYGDITPILNGVTFEGAIFPVGLTPSEITTTVTQGVTYTEYLFNGITSFPSFNSQLTDLLTYAPADSSQNYIDLKIGGGGTKYRPKQGDILILTIAEVESIVSEYVKVTSFSNTGGTAGRIYVERGWGGAPTRNLTTDSDIYLLSPVQIFQINRSKVQGLQKGKLYVRDSGDILLINSVGYIVTGSAA